MRTGLNQKLNNGIINTIEHWQLFDKAEKILIGISGGKDSLALLDCLFASGYTNLFSIHIQIDKSAPLLFEQFCKDRSQFTLIKTNILAEIQDKQRKNICYMCSREKRKAISSYAVEHGFQKLALAHHKNDVIETMLLNLLFQREISTMMPRQELFGGKLSIVRPFYETAEKEIIRYAKQCGLPVSGWKCGFESDNRRAWIKEQIRNWQKANPKVNITENLFQAMLNVNTDFLPKSNKQ